ncbi:rna pseudouridine synthase 6 chloroplastic [Phtheirospermum japonicum]|uniref:Rna pseudouridine synthase 6 chloroplastic n=1 Tax=Phtheirospermum japonicum TaxID=374723 RepID=A0A830B336_9LAMI|nr:rna pseudouridine synthase 6 chloroplastic [Phtheirospermum japonicum]
MEKKVKKLYLALAASPVSIGVITHYMRPVNIAPRIVSRDSIVGWQLCQLEVLECKKVPWPNNITEEKYNIEDCEWPCKDFAYELGDSMYMPAAIAEANSPRVNPFGKNEKEYADDDDSKAVAIEEWIALHGKEPSVAIGLQACQISWDDDDREHTYEAGSPWWSALGNLLGLSNLANSVNHVNCTRQYASAMRLALSCQVVPLHSLLIHFMELAIVIMDRLMPIKSRMPH